MSTKILQYKCLKVVRGHPIFRTVFKIGWVGGPTEKWPLFEWPAQLCIQNIGRSLTGH